MIWEGILQIRTLLYEDFFFFGGALRGLGSGTSGLGFRV